MSILLALCVLVLSAFAAPAPAPSSSTGEVCHVDQRPRKARVICAKDVGPWYRRVQLISETAGAAIYLGETESESTLVWGARTFGPFDNGYAAWSVENGRPWIRLVRDEKYYLVYDVGIAGPYDSLGDIHLSKVESGQFFFSARRNGQLFLIEDKVEKPIDYMSRVQLWSRNQWFFWTRTGEEWHVHFGDKTSPAYEWVDGFVFEYDPDSGKMRGVIRVVYAGKPYSVQLSNDPIRWVPTLDL